MYVLYWKPCIDGQYYVSVMPHTIGDLFSLAFNECIWIIPGTIDPKDD